MVAQLVVTEHLTGTTCHSVFNMVSLTYPRFIPLK